MGDSPRRLVPPFQGPPLLGWVGPLLVAVFGGLLRFVRLGEPKAVVFDETFYVKDAYSLLRYGVEHYMLGDAKDPIADRRLLAGSLDIFKQCAEPADCGAFVAHPPFGKWMIASGEWLFGMNPFGWRFAAALAGTLSILILARVARRMTRSTLLGCLAGLLLALDGLHLVLSRTALLDIFLMFWVLAGFACLVVDRDRARERLISLGSPGVRWWRIAAGVCLALAMSVKWSGLAFAVSFAVMSLMWDFGARRAIGQSHPYVSALRRDVPQAALAFGVVPAVTYLVTWTGWFVSADGYGRDWGQATSSGPVFFVVDSVRSWVSYQSQVLGFHTGVHDYHPYMSDPWTWPLLIRPVSFHYPSDLPPSSCGAASCAQAVLGVGTPALWYAAILALIGTAVLYARRRDWRAGAVLLAYAVGWLPWFYYAIADDRTMYLFYMIPVVPFMVLAIVLMAGLVLGSAGAPAARRAAGAAVVGALALVVLIDFWWLQPVLTAETITQTQWWARMLMRSWVTAAPK